MMQPNLEKEYRHALNLVLKAEFAKALESLESLNEAVPGDHRLVYGRAMCLFMLGRPEEAGPLCMQLEMEFKDSRGERLQAAFVEAAGKTLAERVSVAGPSAAPLPSARRRRWPYVLAFAALLLVNVCFWIAQPVYARLQGQGGQLPSLSDGPSQAAFVAKNTEQVPDTQETNLTAETAALPPPSSKQESPAHAVSAAQVPHDLKPTESAALPPPSAVQGAGTQTVPVSAEPSTSPGNTANAPAPEGSASPSPAVPEPPKGPDWKARLAAMNLPDLPKGPVPSVVELQPYRTSERLANDKGDSVTLTNLNPLIGSWYVLEYATGGKKQSYHLEVFPLKANDYQKPKLALYADGLAVVLKNETQYFPLWAEQGKEPGKTAADYQSKTLNAAPDLSDVFKTIAAARSPVGLLCNNMVIVRQQRHGSTSRLELATDILRETRVGDWLVEKLKPMLIRPPEVAESQASHNAVPAENAPESPVDALVAPTSAKLAHKPKLLNIATEAGDQSMLYGHWYKTLKHPGIYFSVLAPYVIDPAILASYSDRVAPLGGGTSGTGESGSVVYMLAMEMEQYGFGFAVGAEHPNVEWSPKVKKVPGMDGPDGFGSRAPLSTIGALPPYLVDRVAGAFAGGFKREHGTFAFGPFSKINNNSHFGFMENGVLWSRLNPGLATAVMAPDGTLDMFTWPENGDKEFRYLLHARQNGVPLIDGLDASGMSVPGTLVNKSGDGAWSGSASGKLLTIRSGMAIQEHDGHRFLLLGYFTGATPNAMARVYQAYHCRYAMALDMNAPELCYSALYCRGTDGKITGAEYPIKEMSAANGGDHLRFLQTDDTRDCFYFFHR
jgi:hypothetical protein